MALVINDRVRETSTTSGTGDITLGGAVQGFLTFSSGIGTSNTTYYCITESGTANFEVGLGTLSASTTLERTTVISNSAGNTSKINFGGAALDVFVTGPASKSVLEDASNNVTLSDDLTVSGDLKSAALKAADGGNIINQSGTDITIGASGDTVTLASGASQSGFGNVSWVTTVKTANFNAASGEGYFVDSSSNTVTVTLPTGVAGESVAVVDYISNANTNAIFLTPQSGEKIEGATSGQGISTNRQALTLTYSGATQGWLVSSAGESGPIATPTITFATASGTLGTLTDAQRSDVAGNTSSAAASSSFGTLTYAIQSGSLPTGVSLSSAGAFTGTASAVASETTSNFTVRATITETGTISDRAFAITVQAPTITFSTASGTLGTLTDTERSDPAGNLSVVTASTSSGSLTYAIQSGSLSSGITLNSSTGALEGSANVVASTTTSNFTVRATNTSGTTSDRAFAITVEQPTITFSTASGTLGTLQTTAEKNDPAANLSVVTASTSSGSLTYSIASGSLPASMSLNTSTGAFTGTVDEVVNDTTSNFTIRATNTSGTTGDRAFSILVKPNALFVTASGGSTATDGDFKVHTFTSPGTFTVSQAGNAAGSNTVDWLVLAGGGAGGSGTAGAGGAGGHRQNYPNPATGGTPVSAQGYPISVGGGSGGSSPGMSTGGSGSSSSAFGFSSNGGGGGGDRDTNTNGQSGGSGGGGGGSDGGMRSGGSGNSPPVSPSQGNSGGGGRGGGGGSAGGGGGGAQSSGNGSPSSAVGGPGGSGKGVGITGSTVTRGGGGGGGSHMGNASGGPGGGGNGAGPGGGAGSGQSQLGAGGGGAGGMGGRGGGGGGSGIVIIRYRFQE